MAPSPHHGGEEKLTGIIFLGWTSFNQWLQTVWPTCKTFPPCQKNSNSSDPLKKYSGHELTHEYIPLYCLEWTMVVPKAMKWTSGPEQLITSCIQRVPWTWITPLTSCWCLLRYRILSGSWRPSPQGFMERESYFWSTTYSKCDHLSPAMCPKCWIQRDRNRIFCHISKPKYVVLFVKSYQVVLYAKLKYVFFLS